MTPEHKALVATVTKWLDGGCNSWGLPSGEIRKLCAAIEALSAQCAQPQAGEPVAWLCEEKAFGAWKERLVSECPIEGPRCRNIRPLYASPQPANSAQVTDAMVEAASAKYREIGARCNWRHSWPSEEAFHEIITAAIGAGGQAVAVKAIDYEKIDIPSDIQEFGERHKIPRFAEATYRNGYVDGYRFAVSALSQPHPADERVVEALEWERLSNGNLRAFGAFGYRYIVHARSEPFLLHHAGSLTDDKFETEEAAQAAAQADYERRALSALSQPHPADERVVEALPATKPYVDRIVRIFRDKSDDDTSAVVLQDYARAAIAQEGRKDD